VGSYARREGRKSNEMSITMQGKLQNERQCFCLSRHDSSALSAPLACSQPAMHPFVRAGKILRKMRACRFIFKFTHNNS